MPDLSFKQWLAKCQTIGWVSAEISFGQFVKLRCCVEGCEGRISFDLNQPLYIPKKCQLEHSGKYSGKVFNEYKAVIHLIRAKRRELGLSQADLDHITGITDGYTAKIESHARTPSLPTLIHLASSVGYQLTMIPSKLPPASIRVIDERSRAPYDAGKARFKHA